MDKVHLFNIGSAKLLSTNLFYMLIHQTLVATIIIIYCNHLDKVLQVSVMCHTGSSVASSEATMNRSRYSNRLVVIVTTCCTLCINVSDNDVIM